MGQGRKERAEGVRVGFVQTDPTMLADAANLARQEELVRSADSFDLLVLPELATSGYLFRDREECLAAGEATDGPSVTAWRRWAKSRGGWIVGGFVERAGDRVFNAAALVGPQGECHVYRKIHLFGREKHTFDPGDRPFEAHEIETARGWLTVGVMICFDWYFPESARSLALLGAEVLLHPSNLVLPHCQGAMPTRCLENRVFAVTANRVGSDDRGDGLAIEFTGASQVSGPGEIRHRAPVAEESVHVQEVDLTVARSKRVTDTNDLLADRRPDLYRL